MRKKSTTESGLLHPRVFAAFLLCLVGISLAVFSSAGPPPNDAAPVVTSPAGPALAAPTATPTFGHPVMAGLGGSGYEIDLRSDPSDHNRIYMSAPGALSADTSWIWRSLDSGKTFKWVPNAAPNTGKVTTCHGGGDTELGVDSAGHLYFNDLTLANFSTTADSRESFGAKPAASISVFWLDCQSSFDPTMAPFALRSSIVGSCNGSGTL